MGDQHPELGAPVAHMVQPQHRVPTKLQHPSQGVADDRGTQMPHMHLLGDVGTGEVHNHRRRTLDGRNAKPLIAQAGGHFRSQALGSDREVDEPRACDLRLQAQLGERRIRLQLLDHGRGDLTRCLLQRLGQWQSTVGLEIPEFGLARWRQLRVQASFPRLSPGLGERPLHRTAQLCFKGVGDAEHGRINGLGKP